MKSLTKEDAARRDELAALLKAKEEALKSAGETFNAAVRGQWESVAKALAEYNTALAAAEDFRETIYGEMTEYYEERSEKWKDSESGADYREVMDQWEWALEVPAIEEPYLELELSDGVAQAFAELPVPGWKAPPAPRVAQEAAPPAAPDSPPLAPPRKPVCRGGLSSGEEWLEP